ncbi:MAG TPA: HPr family phosphocarrier protein [Gammaproteobacteria bacterium]|nr:HPr family phosphocarrier protein [Gammaproteobacteria bacterium]
MAEREITIRNKLGLHARAAAKLVTLASRFDSEIRLRKGDRTVNGKSIMGVLMLAAGQGTRLRVEAEGGDARDALEKIEELIRERFGESE